MDNLFLELSVVLSLAGIISFAMHALKQPSIIGYIFAGLIVGPLGIWHLGQDDALHSLSKIGIALLLFLVGLELDIGELKKLGKNALLIGVLQILITTLVGIALAGLLGFGVVAAAYIGIALTLSSTIIVIKLLSEKRDLQSLYGRIVIGILVTQDLFALIILVVLSSFSGDGNNLPLWQQTLFTITKALIVGLAVIGLSKKVLPKILRYIGQSDELLLIFSLAWALGLAAFVSQPFMGFSLEMGGFVAGLALAGSAVHHEISARIRSIRDFFLIIFFIVLGSSLSFANIYDLITPAVLLSLFVIIGNPLIVLLIMAALGYKPRTSFMAGVSVGQISEFSLILIALGVSLGHLENPVVSLVTIVTIISIAFSSFFIMYAEKIYLTFQKPLSVFDFLKGKAESSLKETKLENHVVLVGAHRLGVHIANSLVKQKQQFVVIDFNPEVTQKFERMGIFAICGDMTDPYIQELAGLSRSKLIISTLPQLADNLAIIEAVHKGKLKARVIVTAQNEADALLLYENKIDYVLLPHFVGGLHLSKILEERHTFTHLSQLRRHHLRTLGKH